MKIYDLFMAAFRSQVFIGAVFQPIVDKIISGKIDPKKFYVQTFDEFTFSPYNADVVFTTTAGDTCYLFQLDYLK